MSRTNTNWKVVYLFEDRANKIDCNKHFNPHQYDITIKKIAKIRKTSSCVYNLNYHYTWIPKTRAKILVEPFKSDVKKFLLEKCSHLKWEPLALQIMPNHLHFFVSAPPKFSPAYIVQQLKAYSSKEIRKKYAIIRKFRTVYDNIRNIKYDKKDFWASGYYCGCAGHVTATSVARYIAEQNAKLKNKWNLFDLKPFEYDITEDSIMPKSQTNLDAFA